MPGGNYEEHPWRVVTREERQRAMDEVAVRMPEIPNDLVRTVVDRATGDITRMMNGVATRSPLADRLFICGNDEEPADLHWTEATHAPIRQREVAASAREFDLRRRLDRVRQILHVIPGCEVSRVEIVDKQDYSFHASSSYGAGFARRQDRFFLSHHDMDELNRLLSHDDVPPIVYDRGGANMDGEVFDPITGQKNRIQLTGKDRLERGTILDAAARPIRKFKLLEE